MIRQLYIISHSHWDREWHQTFQQFRLRLVQLVDDILLAMAAGPDFAAFMLDGQTVVLEDYAEIRPEGVEELRARIREGRVLVGPWYVHPDEFLVSGEAIIRNLLLGARLCAAWGGNMAVGYVPDQFGHIAQLPQIWQGFGIDTAVLWRGVARDVARTAFRWQAPDGSMVLVAALPDGYSHAERLPTASGAALAERLLALAASQEPLLTGGQPLLIMNGGDHTGIQTGLPATLLAAAPLLGDRLAPAQSTLPAYLEALRAAGEPETVLAGELRDCRTFFLLPAVLSTRIWIKQRNMATQTLLERVAEPLASMAYALGDTYPAGELRQSWRYLLQNQPHDSICGCGIDQVHREMAIRFDWAAQIAREMGARALGSLFRHVDRIMPGAEDPRALAILVYNGAPVPQGGRVELSLHLQGEAQMYELIDAAGAPVPLSWLGERGEPPTVIEAPWSDVPDLATLMAQIEGDRVFGMGVTAISMRTMGEALQVEVTLGDQAAFSRAQIEQAAQDLFDLVARAGCIRVTVTIHRSNELRLAVHMPEVPACGYRTFLLRPRSKRAASAHQVHATSELLPRIENERFRVEADPATGALSITDLASNLCIGPAHIFVDGGERGDLYTYCPPAYDRLVTSAEAPPTMEREVSPLGQSLRIRWVLPVPAALTEQRFERTATHMDLPITTTVTLAPGDPLIRFHTTVENRASDHRLRVHFGLPFAVDQAHAEDAFSIVTRPAQPDRTGDWAELPVGTAPHQGFVAVQGAPGACVLAARGLPEYEVLPREDGTTELALTLLRCTGWLSRGDLATRPGDAGPTLATPEAQCHGTHDFDYALTLGREPWRDLVPAARSFAAPLLSHVGPVLGGRLPHTASFVAITPAALVLSALKGAEDGRGTILRFYNDGSQTQIAGIALLLPVRRVTLVDLAERDGVVLFEGEPRTQFTLEAPAARIVSLRLEWAGRVAPYPKEDFG
jgi:alpha-mannosidase